MKKIIIGAGIALLIASSAYAATSSISIGTGINQVGNTASGSTGVTVDATVAASMTMDITNNAINFGPLNLGVTNTGMLSSKVTLTSNAVNATVKATYAQLTHNLDSTPLTFNIDSIGDNLAGNSVAGVINSGGDVITQNAFSAVPVVSIVSYVANPTLSQKVGAYSTSVLYTATGNF